MSTLLKYLYQNLSSDLNHTCIEQRSNDGSWKEYTTENFLVDIASYAKFLSESKAKRIGIIADSSYEYSVCLFSSLFASTTLFPFDSKLSHLETCELIEHSEVQLIIYLPAQASRIKKLDEQFKDIEFLTLKA